MLACVIIYVVVGRLLFFCSCNTQFMDKLNIQGETFDVQQTEESNVGNKHISKQ